MIAAFPITPSTEIPQFVSSYKAEGKITTEFVTVESEHSAMSACIGAEAAGVRAMTATSSCGLALMHEMLYVAASSRLPIVLAAVNRALTGPININNDHSDTMGSRDAGWIQLYSENAQEAYDNMLMAHRIAEHPDVMLPVMVCQDGFITSHAVREHHARRGRQGQGLHRGISPRKVPAQPGGVALGGYLRRRQHLHGSQARAA